MYCMVQEINYFKIKNQIKTKKGNSSNQFTIVHTIGIISTVKFNKIFVRNFEQVIVTYSLLVHI